MDSHCAQGPDNGFNTIVNAKKNDDASVLAQSKSGDWYFVWSDSGDGWAHETTVNVEGDTSTLPAWPNPIRGYIYKPKGSIDRPTDLKNGADSSLRTLSSVFQPIRMSKFWHRAKIRTGCLFGRMQEMVGCRVLRLIQGLTPELFGNMASAD